MSTKETAVRQAAAQLHAAITEGRAAGLSITWPSSPEGLSSIAISETARAVPTVPANTRRAKPKVTK